MFEYLETSTAKEKEQLSEEVKALIFGLLDDENKTFSEHREHPKSRNLKHFYFESVQRLGGVCDVLELLGVDVEKIKGEYYGNKI